MENKNRRYADSRNHLSTFSSFFCCSASRIPHPNSNSHPYLHSHRYRKDKPWDTDDIDHWKVDPVTPEEKLPAPLEESSFATLFPTYREQYIREVWPIVTKYVYPLVFFCFCITDESILSCNCLALCSSCLQPTLYLVLVVVLMPVSPRLVPPSLYLQTTQDIRCRL